MFVVTGATGQLGHLIVKKLVARMPASLVGASVRNPDKAVDLTNLGVRVRQGNFDNPKSLRHAFEGATQVLIISSNARASGGDPLAQHRNAIEAAKAVGVTRIFYTSHMAVSSTSAFPPMHDHAATEEMLRNSGVAWTALRHGFYASSGVAMLGEALKSGTLETPADGKMSRTAHDDLAEADAIIMTSEKPYDGPTPPLTGAQALDFGDLALIAADITSKPILRTVLTDDEMRSKIAARGTPSHVVAIVMGLYIAARNREFAHVDSTLEKIIGRPPLTMREVMAGIIEQSKIAS